MDGKRWSVKQWLAVLVCGVALTLGSGAGATTSTLLATDFTYSLAPNPSGGSAVLTVDYVANQTDPPRISGELTLELWAYPTPYPGLGVAGYQQGGYRLASFPLGRLAPGYFLRGVNSGPIPYAPPPPGTWHVSSLITEYDASAINEGGSLPRAFFNYPTTLTVTVAPPAATPQPGLWWDPTQIGSGYSINVSHGVMVVVTYAYLPDGTAQWYLSSGPLANGGQSFAAPMETFVGGPCIPCTDVRHPTPAGSPGSILILFSSPTAATVYLPGGRIAHIVPAAF